MRHCLCCFVPLLLLSLLFLAQSALLCEAQAPLFALDSNPSIEYVARTSTFGVLVTPANIAAWQQLRLVVADASESVCTYSVPAPAPHAVLLITDAQPDNDWSATCVDVQYASRPHALGYAAVLVQDSSGTRGPPPNAPLNSTAPLHSMRGVAPELDLFLALYISKQTGDAVRDAVRTAATATTTISFLVSTDDRSQQRAWLAYFYSWTVVACVLNSLLFVAAAVGVTRLLSIGRCTAAAPGVQRVKWHNNALLALAAAGASCAVLVIFAAAAYQRARPFLSTPGYASISELNEALQVVALLLYAQSWARAAAHFVPALPSNELLDSTTRACVLGYMVIFLSLSIARGYIESLWLVAPVLNVCVLALDAALFVAFGAIVIYSMRDQNRALARKVVRRTLVFLCIVVPVIVGKFVLTVVVLSGYPYLIETCDAILLAFDVTLCACIILVVVSVVPRLESSASASASGSESGSVQGGSAPRGAKDGTARRERLERKRAAAAADTSLPATSTMSSDCASSVDIPLPL